MVWTERREPWTQQSEDARDAYDVDYSRIVHSASFRRLQGKTQVFGLGDGDFYRTRLTHSLEVAQLAVGIAQQFSKDYRGKAVEPYLPSPGMIQAAGAIHDLGHPPFGHGGEVALNYCMRGNGGFEGNGQTLRSISRLEKFSSAAGANLTRRTMLSVLKYPVPFSRASNPQVQPRLNEKTSTIKIIDREASKPPKCYLDTETDVVDWILSSITKAERDLFTSTRQVIGKHARPLHKSFDCSIMDLADDIAFGVHDLEDALSLELVTEKDFRNLVPEGRCGSFLTALKDKYPTETENDVYEGFVGKLFSGGQLRKRHISRMVHHMIANCRIEEIEGFDEPLLKYRAVLDQGPKEFLDALKILINKRVVKAPALQQLEFKGQSMVVAVFEALSSEPEAFLPRNTYERWEASTDRARVICDHIAGMTDGFLLKTYDRLFSPRMGSVFDQT